MGTRLKRLRAAKEMSQAALAKRAGLTREYVNKLEADVAIQNRKKPIEYPSPRDIARCGKVMSRSCSGSTIA